MELLVKRDINTLMNTEGRVFVDSDVPDFLKVPRVVPKEQVKSIKERYPEDDLLIQNGKDHEEIDHHFKYITSSPPENWFGWLFYYMNRHNGKKPIQEVPSLWSGYRSSLVRDPKTNKWFRLKGISLNPLQPEVTHVSDGFYRIQGGQEKYSAEFEQIMSNRFNRILEDVGIEPVMKVKGMWKYPILARRTRPAASVIEVKGDTRLDELIFILAGLASSKFYVGERNGDKVDIGMLSHSGEKFSKTLGTFCYDVGYVVGRLKRLMDKSGQTWSSDYEQSNAHVGNIVLYNGTDKLKVGLVDFDASCDTREFSRSQLKAIQKGEYEFIRKTIFSNPISPRAIQGKPSLFLQKNGFVIGFNEERGKFVEGFDAGYKSEKRSYSNEVDLGKLMEIFELLKNESHFSVAPPPRYKKGYGLEEIIRDKIDDRIHHDNKIDINNIIRKQYGYQSLGNLLIKYK